MKSRKTRPLSALSFYPQYTTNRDSFCLLGQVELAANFGDLQLLWVVLKSEQMDAVCDFINQLKLNPTSFDYDSIAPTLIEKLTSTNLQDETIRKIVDHIYETCLLDPQFRRLSLHLCDDLAHSTTGIPKFRTFLIRKLHRDSKEVLHLLDSNLDVGDKARNFALTVAELFFFLKPDNSDWKRDKFAVLARLIVDVVRKLMDHANDENLRVAVQILEKTAIPMKKTLRGKDEDTLSALDSTLGSISALVCNPNCHLVLNNETHSLLKTFVDAQTTSQARKSDNEQSFCCKEYYPVRAADLYDKNAPTFIEPGIPLYMSDHADDFICYVRFLENPEMSNEEHDLLQPNLPGVEGYNTMADALEMPHDAEEIDQLLRSMADYADSESDEFDDELERKFRCMGL